LPNFVIHAPPRTGGFSVRWLFEQELGIPLFHVHYLQNPFYYQNKGGVQKRIDRIGRKKYKVICTVRDPIARNLSEYWRLEYIDRHAKPRSSDRVEKGLHRKPGTNQEKFFAFIDHYRQHHFFGSELIPFWGINIFKRGWSPPYVIYDDQLLVIRTKDLNEYGMEAFSKLLGEELTIPMPHKNVVPVVRPTIPMTEAYIYAMYRDKYFPRAFYNEDEIEEMKDKWQKLIGTGPD
jgi:hypothetical protein